MQKIVRSGRRGGPLMAGTASSGPTSLGSSRAAQCRYHARARRVASDLRFHAGRAGRRSCDVVAGRLAVGAGFQRVGSTAPTVASRSSQSTRAARSLVSWWSRARGCGARARLRRRTIATSPGNRDDSGPISLRARPPEADNPPARARKVERTSRVRRPTSPREPSARRARRALLGHGVHYDPSTARGIRAPIELDLADRALDRRC